MKTLASCMALFLSLELLKMPNLAITDGGSIDNSALKTLWCSLSVLVTSSVPLERSQSTSLCPGSSSLHPTQKEKAVGRCKTLQTGQRDRDKIAVVSARLKGAGSFLLCRMLMAPVPSKRLIVANSAVQTLSWE